MRKNRLASFSIAATTILTLGGAGCGDLKDIADELLNHTGGSSGGSGGSNGSTAPGCDYQGKTYPLGSSIPSADGCNRCTCDKTGIACTAEACAPPDQSCEKVPVVGADGACVPFDQWKVQSVDVCVKRGESLSTLEFGAVCEDGASTREVFLVCCKTPPANDVACVQSIGADGALCTVCRDATGVVVKTDCIGDKS